MRTFGLKKRPTLYVSLLIAMITLNACGVSRYDTKESTKAILPTLVQYGDEIQDKAIEEVEGGQCQAHVEFAKDYIHLRDKIRLIKDELR